VEGESLLLNMDLEGIAVSSGSACTSGSSEASHVILAMGKSPLVAQSAIRFSLGWTNTGEDVDYALEVVPPILERLRAIFYRFIKSITHKGNELQRTQRRKTGKMEYWNIGMMDKKNEMPKPIVPLFHNSSIPICLLCALCASVVKNAFE
jgi:hypothetical protein